MTVKNSVVVITALALIVVIFGTIYVVVQQAQRSDANFPQIQMAEDKTAALNSGARPENLVKGKVDMAHSLATFTIIYDSKGKVVKGSGYINGKVPTIDYDALQTAKGKTYNAITWQPQSGVRVASVTVAAKNYYVLSGRSLSEVENNENKTFMLAALGGFLSVVVVAVAVVATKKV